MSFRNNDLPGVMLAASFEKYIQRYDVVPDNNPVIFLENELLYGEKFEFPSQEDEYLNNSESKIDKAKKEAERKKIEADGISDFQRIVNRTITPQLLKWKGVEATQEISKSPNSKVIVIGNGDGDLPIIVGGQ